MEQITRLNASNFFAVVYYFGPWLDQRVKYYVTVKVDDADSSKSFAFLREDFLTIHRQNLCLSLPKVSQLN